MAAPAKTSFHREKVLLEVKTEDAFSYLPAMSRKNKFVPWMSVVNPVVQHPAISGQIGEPLQCSGFSDLSLLSEKAPPNRCNH
jgi:hypothetical protein